MEKKDILVGLLVLLLILTSLGAYSYYSDSRKRIKKLKTNVSLLKQDLDEKKSSITELESRLTNTSQELNRSLSRIENLTAEVEVLESDLETAEENLENLKEENEDLRKEVRLAQPIEKDYYLLAVSDEEGEILNLSTEVQTGDGEVSVTVNKAISQNDTQFSVNKAWRAAELYTGSNLSNYDGEIRVKHSYEGYLSVTGDSGGAAFAVTFIAALENKTIDKKVLITGSVEPDGNIGQVGDIRTKVKAARNFGAEKVLVPPGSNVDVSGIEEEEVFDIEEAASIVLY